MVGFLVSHFLNYKLLPELSEKQNRVDEQLIPSIKALAEIALRRTFAITALLLAKLYSWLKVEDSYMDIFFILKLREQMPLSILYLSLAKMKAILICKEKLLRGVFKS